MKKHFIFGLFFLVFSFGTIAQTKKPTTAGGIPTVGIIKGLSDSALLDVIQK
jgi:hypothetical protein